MTWPKLAVPAYIHPGAYAGDWDRIIGAGSDAVPLVVANVADGPGDEPDEGWRDVIGRARDQGIAVLGYVDTGYLGHAGGENRDAWLDRTRAGIDAWYAHYGDAIGGIFFDRAQRDLDAAPVYRRLGDDVKRRHPGAVTALNPGGVVPDVFEHAGDVLVTFEGTLDRYLGEGPPAGALDWMPGDPARIWHLVYDVPGDRVAEVVERSRRRRAGRLYVTDRSVPNPWGTLTTYWDRLVALVQAAADGSSRRPGSPARPA